MMYKEQENFLILILIMIIGFGLEYFGYQLIHSLNHKKTGYFVMGLGLIFLFANAVVIVMRVKK